MRKITYELYEDEHKLVLFVCVVSDKGKCLSVLTINAEDTVVAIGTAELLATDPNSWCDWHGSEIPELFYERGILDNATLLAHYDGYWHEDNQPRIRRNKAASAFLKAYYDAISEVGIPDCDDCRISGLISED